MPHTVIITMNQLAMNLSKNMAILIDTIKLKKSQKLLINTLKDYLIAKNVLLSEIK